MTSFKEAYDKVERRIEDRYGIPVSISDVLDPNTGDFDGVNLAAIQALARRTETLQAENAELRAQNRVLRERLDRLEALVTDGAKQ